MLLKLLLWQLLSLQPSAPVKIPDRYDHYIAEACSRYLTGIDCDWYKALLYAESNLTPTAKSPVGAMGVAQIMPGTWDQAAKSVPGSENPYEARASIRVGAFYLSQTVAFWKYQRPDIERLYLGMASYNAGPGNILKAQRKCGGALHWRDIAPCLPAVTGHHSKETINYVNRIKNIFCRIKSQKGAGIWGLDAFNRACFELLSIRQLHRQKVANFRA